MIVIEIYHVHTIKKKIILTLAQKMQRLTAAVTLLAGVHLSSITGIMNSTKITLLYLTYKINSNKNPQIVLQAKYYYSGIVTFMLYVF